LAKLDSYQTREAQRNQLVEYSLHTYYRSVYGAC